MLLHSVLAFVPIARIGRTVSPKRLKLSRILRCGIKGSLLCPQISQGADKTQAENQPPQMDPKPSAQPPPKGKSAASMSAAARKKLEALEKEQAAAEANRQLL
eukprot:6199091-Pleurochrysis_carterae.AAC.3